MRPSEPPIASRRTFLPWAVVGCLLLAVGIVYGQTLWFDFLNYDDQLFVSGCPPVRAGLTADSIAWAFTNGPAGEWYPVSMLSHMLDCELYGLNSTGHFFTNLLLHAATAIVLFAVLRHMTDELWPSALAAAVFAVHPQHVESVAWIAERRDVLSGFFFVLTLAAYLGYVRHGRSLWRYLLVAALLALGLMAKAMLVTVPALLLLLDYWPLGRFGRAADLPPGVGSGVRQTFGRLALEKLPLLAIALADCARTMATHAASDPLAWSDRISNALVSTVTYLVHSFYPVSLAAFYPYAAGGEPLAKVAGAACLLTALTAGAVLTRRRWPYCFVGWFWFLGMLTPVLGLAQISAHAMADRYMYLPAIGLYIALAWSAWRLCGRSVAGRRALGAGAAVALAVLTGLSVRQTSYWRDGETLWNHAIAVTGDTSEAEIGLAEALSRPGRWEEAVGHYRRAVAMVSEAPLFCNFGVALLKQDKLDEAAEQFRRSLALNPNSVQAIANLGTALARQGRRDEAAQNFRSAIQLDPTFLEPRLNLARLLGSRGQIDEAIIVCRRAVEIAPDDPMAREVLAALVDIRARALMQSLPADGRQTQ